jgi:hypothetical protein
LAGCPEIVPRDDVDLSCGSTDAKPTSSDMSPAVAKCAAAAGLPGTNLLCVDFDKVTQLNDPALAGWNFNANMANCWQISGGYLQVQNFGGFMGNCGATLPAFDLRQADKQQYQRVTLALLHRVDMSDPDQQAQVYLDQDSPARLAHQMTGKPGFPTLLTTTVTVNKADLPAALMSVYKFYLKASSLGAVSLRQGWQIQSIAVNATP